MDPAISVIAQNVPNANASAYMCFFKSMYAARGAAAANPTDFFATAKYFKDLCKDDANLVKALEAFTDEAAKPRLRKIVTNFISQFPAQIRVLSLAFIDRYYLGVNISPADTTKYISILKNLKPATKNAIFSKFPSAKKVLNAKVKSFN